METGVVGWEGEDDGYNGGGAGARRAWCGPGYGTGGRCGWAGAVVKRGKWAFEGVLAGVWWEEECGRDLRGRGGGMWRRAAERLRSSRRKYFWAWERIWTAVLVATSRSMAFHSRP